MYIVKGGKVWIWEVGEQMVLADMINGVHTLDFETRS